MTSWVKEEFRTVDLGDERLNARFLKIAEAFLERPTGSMSEITGSWADTKASYRFFENEKVSKNELLSPHVTRTVERISKTQQTILAIQDTTYLDYTHHPKTEGLGKLTRPLKNRDPLLGLIVHNTLAITDNGIPLGLLDQKIYRRGDEDVSKTQWHKKRPIEKKESYRWIEVVKKIKSYFQDSQARIVHVCDREGDIYELLHEVSKTSHEYVIRAAKDRVVGKRFVGDAARKNKNISLWQHMDIQPVSGRVTIEVSETPKRPKRNAICEVRYSEVDCTPSYYYPEAKSGELSPIKISTIWMKEVNCSIDTEPLEWMLLTNIKIKCLEDALEKVVWYKERWHIENYHKVLKSGCNVEKSKLNHADKLEKFATLMSVVAYRIYELKLIGRNAPDVLCTTILTEEEWTILYRFIHKTKELPDHPPTAKEVMHWIAKLGGFLGRKSDGHPGSIVIWRGWQRLMDIIDSWKIFKLAATSG